VESIYLMGSEDVQRAASRIASAAEEMQRAGSNMAGAFEQHQRFMDDWLSRLEAALSQSSVHESKEGDRG
jgi:hypothetical protein